METPSSLTTAIFKFNQTLQGSALDFCVFDRDDDGLRTAHILLFNCQGLIESLPQQQHQVTKSIAYTLQSRIANLNTPKP